MLQKQSKENQSKADSSKAARPRVLIVGMGGLGCPIATSLADHGFPMIWIEDDVVELSNLQRQTLFAMPDLGKDKNEAAKAELERRHGPLDIELRRGRVHEDNAEALFQGADFLIDGTDDPNCRFVVNRYAVQHGLPAVIGGVHRYSGMIMALRGEGPCLRCLFEEEGPPLETCESGGVLGAMPGFIGHLMAERALELLSGKDVTGYITVFDALRCLSRDIPVEKAGDCPVCGDEKGEACQSAI